MEKYQETKDQVKFGQYVFSLEKCKTQEQKQKFIQKLNQLIEYNLDCLYDIRTSTSQEQKSFIYEHLTTYEDGFWKIYQKQTYSAIYKHIPTILFPSTTTINLSYCNITNIQVFRYLQAPNLRTLELYDNHIVTIKPLAKNNALSKMENLTLFRNRITDFSTLQRAKADVMKYFELDIDNSDKVVVCEDLTVFYKVPVISKGLKIKFWCSFRQRITRFDQIMQNRF